MQAGRARGLDEGLDAERAELVVTRRATSARAENGVPRAVEVDDGEVELVGSSRRAESHGSCEIAASCAV